MWTNYILLFLLYFNPSANFGGGEAQIDEAPTPQTPTNIVAPSADVRAIKAAEPRAPKARAARKAQVRKGKASKPTPTAMPKIAAPTIAPEPASSGPVALEPATPTWLSQTVTTAQPFVRVAVAPTASDIVGKVQDFYNKTKSFKATFNQTVTNQTFNKLKPKKSKGRVYILKPGKMRWDYKNKSTGGPKVSKSFISDGKHLWAVMHKNKSFYKEDLTGSTLPVAVSFLMGKGDLRKEFNVATDTPGKYGSKSDLLLLLTPKIPSARYKKLWLVVDANNFSVKQSIVLNTKGDTNSIRFSGVKIDDGTLKNGHFIFNEKANKDFRLIQPPQAKQPVADSK